MYALEDTIVAVSSPPGKGWRGIVRVSGPEAMAIGEQVFRCSGGSSLASGRGWRRCAGQVRVGEGVAFPAAAYVFRAPRSYTGQDLVEFHVPGSAPVLSMVVEAIQARGARPAEPGEFTARAFLSGRMDLTQAESVAAIIAATSDAEIRAARRLAEGALVRETASVLDRLADLTALVEADIDFSEEPIDFISPAELRMRLETCMEGLSRLAATTVQAERLEALPRVMLTGRPNAGKSTLLNRLTGIRRALCSPVPGTTRDVIGAPLRLRHSEVLLLDGAGLLEEDEAVALPARAGAGGSLPAEAREIDRAARERARRELETVSLICVVIDLAAEPFEPPAGLLSLTADRPRVIAGNKIDLLDREELSVRCEMVRADFGVIVWPVSAKTGEGCEALKRAIEGTLGSAAADVTGQALALNARHRTALAEALAALQRAIDLTRGRASTVEVAELVACELREAMHHLGTISGQVTTEDLLGRVFSRFCIGK